RGVALVGDVLVLGAARFQAGAALDGAVDVVVRHRALLGLLDGVEQRRVAGGVTAAGPGGHLDVLDQLGEKLAALGVHHRLLVLGGRPVRVPTHDNPFTIETKSWCTRRSGVSSGWNDVARSGPCRTAMILPPSAPRTVTPGPDRSTQGARMNTA